MKKLCLALCLAGAVCAYSAQAGYYLDVGTGYVLSGAYKNNYESLEWSNPRSGYLNSFSNPSGIPLYTYFGGGYKFNNTWSIFFGHYNLKTMSLRNNIDESSLFVEQESYVAGINYSNTIIGNFYYNIGGGVSYFSQKTYCAGGYNPCHGQYSDGFFTIFRGGVAYKIIDSLSIGLDYMQTLDADQASNNANAFHQKVTAVSLVGLNLKYLL